MLRNYIFASHRYVIYLSLLSLEIVYLNKTIKYFKIYIIKKKINYIIKHCTYSEYTCVF